MKIMARSKSHLDVAFTFQLIGQRILVDSPARKVTFIFLFKCESVWKQLFYLLNTFTSYSFRGSLSYYWLLQLRAV